MHWRIATIVLFSLVITARAQAEPPVAHPTAQIALPRVELMPNEPPAFKLLDFNAIARGYDRVVFGPGSKLMWWDETRVNMSARGVGLPSYVDHPEMKAGNNHEAITVLGSILGATLTGIDKRTGEANFAAMSTQYFNSANGANLVLNRVSTTTGQSYWYELFPQILFDAIGQRYPQEKRLAEITDIAAKRWLEAFDALSKEGPPSFEHMSFDFATMQPVKGKHSEPDAAAGMAYLFYNAYLRTKEPKFLRAAETCLKALEDREASASYEILLPFGAYAAARMNAEIDADRAARRLIDKADGRDGTRDVGKLLNDYFEPRSDARAGWGLVVGNWNGVEASGLFGSVNDAAGYGFVMNTYASAMALVPIARYDERYARGIAKWALNAAGAIRYCYPGQLPIENTTRPNFQSDPPNVIAFEGIRHRYKGVSPLAGGDPTVYGWGPCDLGLYGSGFAGVFGGMIRPTTDPLVLELDLLAVDPAAPDMPPTLLYFNPRKQAVAITLALGQEKVDLYDSLANQMIAKNVSGDYALTLPADAARMIVCLPAGATIEHDGRRSSVEGRVFDYENGLLPPRQLPAAKPVVSKAKRIDVPKNTPTIDGDAADWRGHGSSPLKLNTAGRGAMEAAVQYAWDDEYLYVLVRETNRGKDAHEAKDLDTFIAAPWDFDAANFYLDLGNGARPSLGDFVLQLGFSSDRRTDLGFSNQSPDGGSAKIRSATSGTRAAGDRVIEARVSWKGLAAATLGNANAYRIASGTAIGCEPMLVEMNHTRQSFLGGSQYQRPTGTDANSVDLVLMP